jgi:hypothetical protein
VPAGRSVRLITVLFVALWAFICTILLIYGKKSARKLAEAKNKIRSIRFATIYECLPGDTLFARRGTAP